MGVKSAPIRVQPAVPKPAWWQRTPLVAVLVSGAAALGLGLWVASARTAAPEPAPSAQAEKPEADAVTRVLSLGKPTVVEFGSNNCTGCREMKPVLHALAQDARIAVADVDILKERDYITRYQIRLMPTQVFYDAAGREIGRHMGKLDVAEVYQHLGLPPLASGASAANHAIAGQ